MGIIFLAMSLFGVPVYASFGLFRLEGIWGGLGALILAPVLSAAMFWLISLLAFVPFNWFVRARGGLTVFGKVHPAPQSPEWPGTN